MSEHTRTDADTATERFDIPVEVAEVYEQRFVPSIFAEWAPVILDAAGVTAGDRLLDVACGTGIVARAARRHHGTEVELTGVDLNPAMLTVAGRLAADITWQQGDVAALPFDDDRFDTATCQMAAMFFPDLGAALAEMARVVRPGGRLAWVVPGSLSEQPAYGPFVEVAVAHTDDRARSLLGTYWNRGDRAAFDAALVEAGLEPTGSRARVGTARFASVADFVATEIDATPLVDRIDDATRARIVDDLTDRLATWVEPGRDLEIPLVCNVVTARVPD